MNCLPDQIFRTDLQCATCEYCPPGSVPDSDRERCIVSPRPAVIVGLPSCGVNSYYNWDRTECVPCPIGTIASADKARCIGTCNGPNDIIKSDGTCFTCVYGNVPDASRTRCVKRNFFLQQEKAMETGETICFGEREIYSKDKSECVKCLPYTRAQKDNSVCLSDACGQNQIITWLGTCADCEDGEEPDADRESCVKSGRRRMQALNDTFIQ